MRRRTHGTLMVIALGLGLSTAAAAQHRPTTALLPTQYFSANGQSAQNVIQTLAQQFESRGYRVVPMERSPQTFQELGVHPQLLAMGLPLTRAIAPNGGFNPETVSYLRVLNTQTGKALYTRQVGHEISHKRLLGSELILPRPITTAADDKLPMVSLYSW